MTLNPASVANLFAIAANMVADECPSSTSDAAWRIISRAACSSVAISANLNCVFYMIAVTRPIIRE